MAGLGSNDLAWLTARCGVARCATARCGAVAQDYELKADGTGEFIWERDPDADGGPRATSLTWGNDRE